MINIDNISKDADKPFQILKDLYKNAIKNKQSSVEAIVISSIGPNASYSDARFVNLKYITDNSLIFFTNYESNKANHFNSYKDSMITSVIYWNSIDTQIRIRGPIEKCSIEFSDKHFMNRDRNKNAIAISSKQSQKVKNYDAVLKKYKETLEGNNLTKRPSYWGGYKIKPIFFEFWHANEFRINKREVYEKNDNNWTNYFLQP